MLATIIAKNVEALKKNIIIFLYTKYRIQNKIDQLPDPLYSVIIEQNLVKKEKNTNLFLKMKL